MSKGVLLDKDAARRTRDAVRHIETVRDPADHRTPHSTSAQVFVRITEDIGEGEYKAEAVKRDGGEWVVRDKDIFTEDNISIFEFNGVAGIDLDTVVEVSRFWDRSTPTTYWAFGAVGGTSVFAIKILGKVEPANNPDEDRWYCEVYPDGKHGDPLDQSPPLDDGQPTVDHILYILTIDTGVTLPNGQLWTWGIKTADVDSLIDTPHESTPGFHYEGQLPLWFCEP
jgi:hypothetical protein